MVLACQRVRREANTHSLRLPADTAFATIVQFVDGGGADRTESPRRQCGRGATQKSSTWTGVIYTVMKKLVGGKGKKRAGTKETSASASRVTVFFAL